MMPTLQPASSVSVRQLQRMPTITTITTLVATTPTSTSTVTTLGIGLSAPTFPSIGIHSTAHSIGIAGAAAHTGTVHIIAGDGMITAGTILIITTIITHIMAEAAWATMLQASDATAITHLARSVIAHNSILTAEIRQAFQAGRQLADQQQVALQADRLLAERRQDQPQVFPEESAQRPVHQQTHQVHVQA